MKTSFYKKNPKKILGYLMALAMVLFSFTNSIAQCTTVNVQISTASWANEISWDLTDSAGTVLASGIPEKIAKVKKSFTGQFLQKVL